MSYGLRSADATISTSLLQVLPVLVLVTRGSAGLQRRTCSDEHSWGGFVAVVCVRGVWVVCVCVCVFVVVVVVVSDTG